MKYTGPAALAVHVLKAIACDTKSLIAVPISSTMVVCVCPACVYNICQCNGRMVKTEVLPWAYWNLMMKGFVPWSEAKNAIKAVKARLQQLQETPASLPQ